MALLYLKRIGLILVLFFISCGGPSEITEEIEGEYKFKYPTGQVEVISIKNDHTFRQTIYADEQDYLSNGQVLYRSDGVWAVNGVELEFERWLEFCEFGDPNKILQNPEPLTMLNVTWHASTLKRNAFLNVYAENGYVFNKVDN